MFDRIVNVRGDGEHHHFHRSEVHEHRAPTDKSVELLKEMEKAAQDKLLGSVRLEGCEVSCVVHRMSDHLNMDEKFIIRYQLGSKRNEVRHTFRSGCGQEHDEMQRLGDELLDALAKDIAANILAPALTKALPRLV